ncbi:hypothetical protein [Luteimonas terrae]|uniref:Uncharacterized protein n=1 Tax=Luteimonas terrae TaxID=1530191 RepID=A0ABU1XS08_9GAMM|nr:hypothetical protein [Luteimonas terrae]MDR7191551.1 hypothetical protein [Luteimonas terrae]
MFHKNAGCAAATGGPATLDSDDAWPGATHAVLQATSTERFEFRLAMRSQASEVITIKVLHKADGRYWQTLCLARMQLRLPQSSMCPGAVFEWGPATHRFEDRWARRAEDDTRADGVSRAPA